MKETQYFNSQAETGEIDRYLDEQGKLTIPCGVEVISSQIKKSNLKLQIKDVQIPDTVKIIETGAFGSYIPAESIDIPDSVIEIQKGAFQSSYFKSIHLSSQITKIASLTFADCQNLKTINIPENITVIEEKAFKQCEALEELQLPDSITEIGESTFKRSGIKNINIPKKLDKIQRNTFEQCWKLEKIIIPSNIQLIDAYAFKNCTTLKEVTIENGLEVIEYSAFSYCKSLQYIEFPESVQNIDGSAFADCTGLECVAFQNKNCKIAITTFESTKFDKKQISTFPDECEMKMYTDCKYDGTDYLMQTEDGIKCILESYVNYYIINDDNKKYYQEQCPEDKQILKNQQAPYQCVSLCTPQYQFKYNEQITKCTESQSCDDILNEQEVQLNMIYNDLYCIQSCEGKIYLYNTTNKCFDDCTQNMVLLSDINECYQSEQCPGELNYVTNSEGICIQKVSTLSTGVIIGISVGAAVVVIAIIVTIILVLKKKTQHKKEKEADIKMVQDEQKINIQYL